jgi:hypothetical protein
VSRYLEIDRAQFQGDFNRRPFALSHRLADHPLFSLERIIHLAQRLPASNVEYNAGDIPISQDPRTTPQNGLSIAETVRRIETCRSWMVLKRVETDPEYGQLLDACLDEVAPITDPIIGPMRNRRGYVFVSSPNSTTPYHIDHEYNFLLQIRGPKFANIWEPADRAVLSEKEIEDIYLGRHRNLVYRDNYQQRAHVFAMKPGVAVHFPVNAPHYIKTGDSYNVSFSITFQSPQSERRSMVYNVNGRLRSIGVVPVPYGESPIRDAAKLAAFRIWTRAERALGRSHKAKQEY